MMNGIWGTLAVGLFATDTSPAMKSAGIKNGLFYGGGFTQLWYQHKKKGTYDYNPIIQE